MDECGCVWVRLSSFLAALFTFDLTMCFGISAGISERRHRKETSSTFFICHTSLHFLSFRFTFYLSIWVNLVT